MITTILIMTIINSLILVAFLVLFFSIKEAHEDTMLYITKNSDKTEEKDDFSLEEVEKYQQLVKNKHKKAKKQTISLGKQGNKVPYNQKPPFERSKSAPPGE